jgi:hypothetical protein
MYVMLMTVHRPKVFPHNRRIASDLQCVGDSLISSLVWVWLFFEFNNERVYIFPTLFKFETLNEALKGSRGSVSQRDMHVVS